MRLTYLQRRPWGHPSLRASQILEGKPQTGQRVGPMELAGTLTATSAVPLVLTEPICEPANDFFGTSRAKKMSPTNARETELVDTEKCAIVLTTIRRVGR